MGRVNVYSYIVSILPASYRVRDVGVELSRRSQYRTSFDCPPRLTERQRWQGLLHASQNGQLPSRPARLLP